MVSVSEERCSGCASCLDACPVGAISLLSGKARINLELCCDCHACVQACPIGAIIEEELPVVVANQTATVSLTAPEPLIVRGDTPVKEMTTLPKSAVWIGAGLSLVGREIALRLADLFVDAVERRLTCPVSSNCSVTPRRLAQAVNNGTIGRAHRYRRRRGVR